MQGCGGGGDPAPAATSAPEPAKVETTPAPTPPPTGAGGCECIPLPDDVTSDEKKLTVNGIKYDPTYGSTCATHDIAIGECTGDSPPGWCKDSWCYVEKECALSDVTESFYFESKSGLYYSYSNCGSTDSFAADACGKETTSAGCRALEQCAFDKGKCVEDCNCIGLPTEVTTDDAKRTKDGILYDKTYGGTCAAHDIAIGSCATDANPKDWCDDSWCYVSKTCALSDVEQSFYFETTDGLYFSYTNCGSDDAFSADACAGASTSTACAAMSQCAFVCNTCYLKSGTAPTCEPPPAPAMASYGYGYGYGYALGQ